MPSLTGLSTGELRDVGDAAETLIDLSDYLPPGDALVSRAGKLRDSIRELLEMPPLEHVSRGGERKMLATMEDADLDRLVKAVNTLLGRFKGYTEEAELDGLLDTVLSALGFELVSRTMMEAGAS
jgi:hypothetical protein